MSKVRETRGTQLVGAIQPGSGLALRNILGGTVAIDPPSIGATTRAAVTFTLTGAKVGDTLILEPPAGLNDDLIFAGAAVTGADQGTVYLYNPTAGAVDDASASWRYTLLQF